MYNIIKNQSYSNTKLCISMLNNINFSILGFYFYYYTTIETYTNIYYIGIIYLYVYYFIDSIVEIYNERYLIIPHHVCALCMISLFDNFHYYLLKNIFYCFSLIEISGGLTNIHQLLKQNKVLHISVDIFLFSIYVYIRQIMFFYHLIHDYNMNIYHEKMFCYISSIVYAMSFYWSIQWIHNIFLDETLINSPFRYSNKLDNM
jgi:hypothetical protein